MAHLNYSVGGDSNLVSFKSTARVPIDSLKVHFKPIQELHGYDNPWPAGGGVNKWDEDWEVGGISSSNGQNVQQNNLRSKNYIPVTAGAEYYVLITTDTNKKAYLFYYDAEKTYIGNSGGYVRGAVTIPSGTAFIRFQCNVNYGYSGYGNDIAINYPATVTTYSPYSNICQISGWTGVEASQSGKNLLRNTATTQTLFGVTFTVNDDGSISLSGTSTQIINYFLSTGAQDFPNGSFVLSGCPAGGGTSTYYLRIDNATGGSIAHDYGGGTGKQQFTLTDGKIYAVYISVKSGVNTNGLVFKPMVELGSTATSYEPYTGQTIPVEFHGKNLCPAATGTDLLENYPLVDGGRRVTITGLDPSASYTFQATWTAPWETEGGRRMYVIGATTNMIRPETADSAPIHKSTTLMPSSDGTIYISANNTTLSTQEGYAASIVNIQLELGSTATAYEPYNNTFYGGYVDIAKGELVQEYISASINGSAAAATWYDADIARDTIGIYCNAGIWVDFTGLPLPAGEGIFDYCATGAVYASDNEWVARFLFTNGSFNRYEMRVPKSVLADTSSGTAMKDSAIAYLNAHPLQAVYKLATPITYQLTPTELSTLLSTNNVWSNANDVTEVSYAVHDSAMIRAAKRRMAASWPKNYLDTAWTHYAYINGSGTYRPDTSDASSRMTNAIVMKAGTYRLKGTNTSTKETLTYRIHEYNASDAWVRQVAYFPIDEVGVVDETFTLDHDSSIRISMAIKYFIGRLTKIPPPSN